MPIPLSAFRSIQLLDERILVQSWRVEALPPGADDYIDYVTTDLFGNTYRSTLYQGVEGDPDLDYFAEDQHESQFETDEMSDDQIVAYFLPLGLDFRDERGHPLRCTIFIAGQAEAALKGIAGQLPNPQEAAQSNWEEDLRRDAARFIRERSQRKSR